MGSLQRNNSRLLWVIVVNGLVIYLLLTSGQATSNRVFALALAAGIILELAGSAVGALLNVAAFLFLPLGFIWAWIWEPYTLPTPTAISVWPWCSLFHPWPLRRSICSSTCRASVTAGGTGKGWVQLPRHHSTLSISRRSVFGKRLRRTRS